MFWQTKVGGFNLQTHGDPYNSPHIYKSWRTQSHVDMLVCKSTWLDFGLIIQFTVSKWDAHLLIHSITSQNINFEMKDVQQKTEPCFAKTVNTSTPTEDETPRSV